MDMPMTPPPMMTRGACCASGDGIVAGWILGSRGVKIARDVGGVSALIR